MERELLRKRLTVAIIAVLTAMSLLAVIAFLPPKISFEPVGDGWVTKKEVERISFAGGGIVVNEMRQAPSDKGYISLTIEANITSEENLAAYVQSRTNALNTLLDSVAADAWIEMVITFKNPIDPQDFASFCETYVEKSGEYSIILTNETTQVKSSEVIWFPRPQETDFIQNLTSIKQGYRLEGIIAFECYLKAETARQIKSDPAVLLIDPLEDPDMLGVKKDYESKGFVVQVERPFSKEMWQQYWRLP